jgi:hypothetical protein
VKYPKIPIIDEDERLESVFGCCEMEKSALYIMRRISFRNDWKTPFDCEDFATKNNMELLVGFCMLLAHGWLIPWDHNGEFVVNEGFARRVVKKLKLEKTQR